ncbi:MAG: hypothetical protein KME18_07620 [Phormidium tanganyikae FI6-MK23]|jgi:hypothetical protein|nr:hypothetical protein [Phormidium tanganyikae FI6-MK23]
MSQVLNLQTVIEDFIDLLQPLADQGLYAEFAITFGQFRSAFGSEISDDLLEQFCEINPWFLREFTHSLPLNFVLGDSLE